MIFGCQRRLWITKLLITFYMIFCLNKKLFFIFSYGMNLCNSKFWIPSLTYLKYITFIQILRRNKTRFFAKNRCYFLLHSFSILQRIKRKNKVFFKSREHVISIFYIIFFLILCDLCMVCSKYCLWRKLIYWASWPHFFFSQK